MKNNICCIFNLAPHYNASTYKIMDRELQCEFFIGDRVASSIKLMNYNDLKGFKKILHYIPLIGKFYWQKQAVNLAFRNYKNYIITGEPYCISTWLILLITKLLGKKTYLKTHGWYGDETLIKKILKKFFFSLSSKVLLYGDYARDLMLKEGFSPEKLVCIYNALNYDQQWLIRQGLKKTNIYKQYFGNEYPVLLYIGRIQAIKKLKLLVEAQLELHRKGIKCNLVIVGEEVENTNIKAIVAKNKLNDYAWFYGACYEEKILGEIIYNADVCVSPGNIGLTAMHSLVYGTPIITHNNFANQMPEFEAIEKGVTGDFFIENSLEDLCSKIEYWISQDPISREKIRVRCYAKIEDKYNPVVQINILKKLFSL